jgi:para-aminobenzoate synthetase component 1
MKHSLMTSAWYWRSLPLNHRTGSDIFAALFGASTSEIATLLESPYPTPIENPQLARYSICAGSPRIINEQPQFWTPQIGEILPFLQKLIEEGDDGGGKGKGEGRRKINSTSSPTPPTPHLPFTGGWLGWLGYDLAWEIEKLPYNKTDSLPFPVAFWYEPENFAVLDHHQQVLWLAATQPSDLDELEHKLITPPSHQPPTTDHRPLDTPELNFLSNQEDYEKAVRQAKKHIQAGDIFQANLSLRFTTQTAASGWGVYQALQKINPSPFACYWRTPWGEVVSCSPERLVEAQTSENQICGDAKFPGDAKFRVSTRPIAGTRSRSTTPETDSHLATELLNNTKERAEHIMLVDLERNDLGRVCAPGTVQVDELLTIERYSHVMHLVSNIKGTLRCECTTIDLIRAMFPGGTITGCPKVRCMEIIEELEPVRRNLFYGSCGYLDLRGNLDLNILIRTLLFARQAVEGVDCVESVEKLKSENTFLIPSPSTSPCPSTAINTVWGQVGAGIVADSDPEREWYESLNKAQAQLAALEKAGSGEKG